MAGIYGAMPSLTELDGDNDTGWYYGDSDEEVQDDEPETELE